MVRKIAKIEIMMGDGTTQGDRKKIADIFDEDDFIVAKESNRWLVIFIKEEEKKGKKKK